MSRNRILFLIFSAFLTSMLLSLWAAPVSLAAPVPPLRVVNHETKECGEIFGRDECMDCFPPEGWEIIGYAFDIDCPEGYTDIDSPGYSCEPFKDQFCCTEGHSGAHGDCEDMVIHRRRKQCAFVSDLYAVEVPRGWRSMPKDLSGYEWACPFEYEWVDEIEEKPLPDNPVQDSRGRRFDIPCCSSAALLGPAVLVAILGRKRIRVDKNL